MLEDDVAPDAGGASSPDFPVTGLGTGDLGITGIEPANGPFAGGTRAVVRGSGFAKGAKVRIGGHGVEPSSTVVDGKSRIEVVVPAGEVGDADVSVTQGGATLVLRGGFRYDALQVMPERGSAAGGTLVDVTVSGSVFDATTLIELDGVRCVSQRLVSPKRMRCKTPKHAKGLVDVVARNAGDELPALEAKGGFEYVDTADTDHGGLSGGPIDGTLDVSVLDAGGGFLLPGAYVLVGNDPQGKYQGLTDERGAITFSGADLHGPVTVHASLQCYERSSIVSFDARRATVFLSPIMDPACMADANPTSGHGVLGSYVSGELVFPGAEEFNTNAWDIVPKPAAGEVRVAYVFTTQSAVDEDNPPAQVEGAMARLEEGTAVRGEHGYVYRLFVRPAGLAVYAVVGLERAHDGAFTAYAMGVARNVVTSPGDETKNVSIPVDITLDRELDVSLEGVPKASANAPNEYRVRALVDLGGEGLIVRQDEHGFIDTLAKPTLGAFRFIGQPAFVGALADASYQVTAGFYTANADMPYTSLRSLGVKQASGPVSLSGFLGIPVSVAPAPGAALPKDRVLRFDVQGKEPDLFVVELTGGDGNPAWMQILPGSAREVPVPDLSSVDEQTDIAAGFVTWQVTAVDVDDFDYRRFQYTQLSDRYITASAANAFTTRAP